MRRDGDAGADGPLLERCAGETCVACGAPRAEILAKKRTKGETKASKRETKRAPRETPKAKPAPKLNGRLSIPAGYGVECYEEEGDLMLEQETKDGTSYIRLSPPEARMVIDWVRELVEGAQ